MSTPETLLQRHDLGCQCWPHVAESDARAAIERVALLEYRSALAAARAESDALRAALEKMATDWEATARSLLIVRGYGENIKGWAFEACASDLRAALAPSPAESAAVSPPPNSSQTPAAPERDRRYYPYTMEHDPECLDCDAFILDHRAPEREP